MTPIAEIRGFRNHNPGNIRHGARWDGLAATQPDKAFCTFVSPEYGIRAMARILVNYERRHGLSTVRDIIHRWAPSVENDTNAYVRHLALRLGVGADEPIDVAAPDLLVHLVSGIIAHECGINPYSRELIRRGIRLALEV